jgi:hypothetical protein
VEGSVTSAGAESGVTGSCDWCDNRNCKVKERASHNGAVLLCDPCWDERIGQCAEDDEDQAWQDLIDLAVASGADVGDLAGLVSAVSDSFGVGGDVGGMRLALSAFLSAGKQVPLSEMSRIEGDEDKA